MNPDRIKRFIEELKRRRVFRGIIVYGASTLVIYEAANNLCNTFGKDAAPPWIVWVLGIGFLGSLWFSWIYDITPGGIVKTEAETKEKAPIPQKQLLTYKTTTFLSLLIIIGLLTYRIVDNSRAKKINQIEKSIAVIPYQGENPSPEEGDIFEFIGSLITSKLINIKDYRVIAWEDVRKYHGTKQHTSAIGEDLEAAILVIWEPLRTNQVEFLSASLIASAQGEVLWSENYQITEHWSVSEIDRYCRKISSSINRKLRVYPTPEEKAVIKTIAKSPKATMYASLGNAIALDSWERFQIQKEHIDTSRSAYVDSLNYEKAINYFSEAIKEDPTFAEAYALRAKTWLWGYRVNFYDQKILDACQKDIWHALELNDELPEAHISQGLYYYYGLNESQLAFTEFEKAVELAPQDTECLFYLAKVSATLGNWDLAKILSDRIFQSKPFKAIYLANLGTIYLYLHEFDKALECQNRAIGIIPEWDVPYTMKCLTFNSMGDFKSSKMVIQEANSRTGNPYHRQLAQLDLLEGRYADAINHIEGASISEFDEYKETNGDFFLMKARIYFHAGFPDKALENYQIAVDFFSELVNSNPRDPMANSQLGMALAGIHQYKMAISNGLQALKLMPVQEDAILEPFIIYNLACIYSRAGDIESSLHSVDELLHSTSLFTEVLLRNDPDLKHLFASEGY